MVGDEKSGEFGQISATFSTRPLFESVLARVAKSEQTFQARKIAKYS